MQHMRCSPHQEGQTNIIVEEVGRTHEIDFYRLINGQIGRQKEPEIITTLVYNPIILMYY